MSKKQSEVTNQQQKKFKELYKQIKKITKPLDKVEVDAYTAHFYEGTWQTVLEDGVYKMLKSKIIEVENPGWDWFYE